MAATAAGLNRWRYVWTPRRAQLWLAAAVAAAWLPTVGVPFRQWLDFSAFYSAGALLFTRGIAELAPVVQFEHAHGWPIVPFVYPPGVALFYAPFAALPFDVAAFLNLALQFAALVSSALIGAAVLGIPRRWAILGALAWAPASAAVLSGQNAATALVLVVIAASAGERLDSPRAGTALAALVYKPQLAPLFVALPAWRGKWTAVVIALGGIVAWYAAGVIATGGDTGWPSTWLETLASYRPFDLAANGWQAVSLPVLLARFERSTGIAATVGWLPDGSVLATVGYAVGIALIAIAASSLRAWTWPRAVALAASLTLFISPHAWVYDAILLLPGLGVVAADGMQLGWPWRHRWLLASAYLLGAAWPLGALIGVTPVAVAVLCAPVVLLAAFGPRRDIP
jgi:hypothetical protein